MKVVKWILSLVFSLSMIALGALLLFNGLAPKETSWFFGKMNIVTENECSYDIADIDAFLNESRSNEAAAAQKYNGQVIRVTGKINLITDSDKETLFTLGKTKNSLLDIIQCSIETEEEYNKLLNLKVGDTVTVIGKVTQCGYTVNLSHCSILTEE